MTKIITVISIITILLKCAENVQKSTNAHTEPHKFIFKISSTMHFCLRKHQYNKINKVVIFLIQ